MAGEMQESSKREVRKVVRESCAGIDDTPERSEVDDLFGIFGL